MKGLTVVARRYRWLPGAMIVAGHNKGRVLGELYRAEDEASRTRDVYGGWEGHKRDSSA